GVSTSRPGPGAVEKNPCRSPTNAVVWVSLAESPSRGSTCSCGDAARPALPPHAVTSSPNSAARSRAPVDRDPQPPGQTPSTFDQSLRSEFRSVMAPSSIDSSRLTNEMNGAIASFACLLRPAECAGLQP